MKRVFTFFIIFLPVFTSCKKDNIDLFGDNRYIYFNTVGGSHELRYSFLYSEGKDVVDVQLPVSYSGKLSDVALGYSVEVDKEKTTAEAGTEYELPAAPEIKGAEYSGKLNLVLKRSPRLASSEQTITLKLVTNANFMAALRDSLVMTVFVTDMISMPDWWDQEVIDAYLGKYSDLKLRLFVENVYAGDYGLLAEDEKLHYARKFKYWLAENPTYEDGELITVPVIG